MRLSFIPAHKAKCATEIKENHPWANAIYRVTKGWMAFETYEQMEYFRRNEGMIINDEDERTNLLGLC